MIKKDSIDLFVQRLDQLDEASIRNYIFRLGRQCTFYEDIINEFIFDGMIVLNDQLEIEFANKPAYKMLGLPQSIIGEKVQRFVKDIDWQFIMSNLQEGVVSRQEIEIFYPQHRYIDFYISTSKEVEKHITLIFQDKTDEREKNQDKFQEEKINTLTMLAGSVAHEIGNPLNSLNIHLQLLHRLYNKISQQQERDEAKEILDIAQQEVKRLDNIIKQFLDAIRNTHPILIQQNTHKLLEESIAFWEQELQDKNIIIDKCWDDNIPQIIGDETQLKQAFFNIIKNASQAMVSGGNLVISATEENNFLKISFADSGEGIIPEKLNSIFDSFQTYKDKGIGLGLFIVSRVMREHKGRVDVSTSKQGTTFSLYFPLRKIGQQLLEVEVGERND